MILFNYFPTLLNALFVPLILSTDCLSRVIKRDEPKGSIPLAYFISDFLIVLSVCVPVFKEPRSTLFQISSTKDSSVFNQSRRSRIISVVSLFLSTCVLPPQHPSLPLLSSCSLGSTLPRIRSSHYPSPRASRPPRTTRPSHTARLPRAPI